MVLTEDYLNIARSLVPYSEVLQSALEFRDETHSLIEQCTADREILALIGQKGDVTYRFNCRIVHSSWLYAKVSRFTAWVFSSVWFIENCLI